MDIHITRIISETEELDQLYMSSHRLERRIESASTKEEEDRLVEEMQEIERQIQAYHREEAEEMQREIDYYLGMELDRSAAKANGW